MSANIDARELGWPGRQRSIGVQTAGCWIDLFELSHFRGRRRRVYGPSVLLNVRSHQPNWGVSVDSVIAGPGAYIRLFHSADPGEAALWLSPKQVISDLPAKEIADQVDSFQIRNVMPRQGDVGFAAFKEARNPHESS